MQQGMEKEFIGVRSLHDTGAPEPPAAFGSLLGLPRLCRQEPALGYSGESLQTDSRQQSKKAEEGWLPNASLIHRNPYGDPSNHTPTSPCPKSDPCSRQPGGVEAWTKPFGNVLKIAVHRSDFMHLSVTSAMTHTGCILISQTHSAGNATWPRGSQDDGH